MKSDLRKMGKKPREEINTIRFDHSQEGKKINSPPFKRSQADGKKKKHMQGRPSERSGWDPILFNEKKV